MLRIRFYSLLIALAMGASGTDVGAQPPVVPRSDGSFLANGGFEVGTQDWTFTGPAEWDRAVRHSGEASLQVTGSGARQDVAGLRVGRIYTCSAWLKLQDVQETTPPGYAFLAIYQFDAAGRRLTSYDFVRETGTADWQRRDYSFEVVPDCRAVAVTGGLWQATGTIWVDDFSLSEGLLVASHESGVVKSGTPLPDYKRRRIGVGGVYPTGYLGLLARAGLPREPLDYYRLTDAAQLRPYGVVIVAGLEEAEVAPVLAAVEEYVAGGGRAIVELAVRPSDHVLAAYRPTFYSGLNIRIVTADHPLTKEYRVGQVLSYGALGGTLIPTHPAEAVVLARYTAEGTAPEYQSSDASQGDGAPALLLIPHGAGYFLYSGPTLGIAMGFQPTGLRSYAPLVLAALRTLTDGALVPQLEVDEEGEKGEEATRLAAGSLDRDTWAHPANAWLPGPDEPGLFWHEGEFFGDVRLEMTFRRSTEPAASATLLFDGDEPGPASRYALVAERVWDTSQVTVRLLRDTTVLEQTVLTVEPTTAQHRLYLARTGSLLCGGLVPERNEGLEDRPLLSCHLLPEGLRPVRVGFRLTGTRARIRDACVRASHIYRYHFNRAPTDWWVGSGTWEITERWSCNPAWAWFGGWNERGIAEVWHKRRFRGDVVLDFFIAPRAMRAGGDEVESWANLGATLCGDGRDVTSGYSVLCGVSGSPRTELRRAGRVVAERSERWLPTSFQGHLQWWHLRFTRRGNHVALWHDRQVILDYRDPNPLPGGQLALWTRDNGLLLPQVTIYFESADGLAPAP